MTHPIVWYLRLWAWLLSILSDKKFWAAVAATILVLVGTDYPTDAQKVVAIVLIWIAYIFGEAYVQAARVRAGL